MKILCVSGYPAWNKVSNQKMPSHHLFGIHELVDYYECVEDSVRGVLKENALSSGYVDFYLWRGGKLNAVRQVVELLFLSREYEIVYDVLNRCSLPLGIAKRLNLFKAKLITVMHHPPYRTQLRIADSDAYIFFNEDYRRIAFSSNAKKSNKYYVNEWRPDIAWYGIDVDGEALIDNKCFFIDNGKSRRDRDVLISAAERTKIRVDYASDNAKTTGWARPYKIDLNDDMAQLKRLRQYKSIIIPIKDSKKEKIGPLGITSYLDAIALGIPVIVSDNACFANAVVEKKVGLKYEAGSSEGLSNAMLELYNNEELYNEFVSNIEAEQSLTIDDYAIVLRRIINAIIADDGSIEAWNE